MGDLPIFDIPWLIPGLLVLAMLVLGLAFYGWRRRRQIAAAAKKMENQRISPEDELKSLGIVAVRRLEEEPGTSLPPPRTHEPDDDRVHLSMLTDRSEQVEKTTSIVEELLSEDGVEDVGAGVARFSPSRTGAPVDSATSFSMSRHPGVYLDQGSPLWHASDPDASPDAVAFLLESLWAAMHAQSVALLRFNKTLSSYAVDALVSERVTRQVDLFPADGNMLNLVPDDKTISILEPDAFAALRYHSEPALFVGHAVAIAVLGPPDRVLLIADKEPGGAPFGAQSIERFGEFADLLASLLPTSYPEKGHAALEKESKTGYWPAKLEQASVGTLEENSGDVIEALRSPKEQKDTPTRKDGVFPMVEFDVEASSADAEPSIKVPTFHPPRKINGSTRTRNEIIAEEMAIARAREEPLALALVVPHNAVELATKGPRIVEEAEQQLIERLRDVAGSTRVELFGELVVGVFSKAGPAFVEAWVERVDESGPDVQIGVALLRARHHSPESFRADAEAALREAYEQKQDCVIVE